MREAIARILLPARNAETLAWRAAVIADGGSVSNQRLLIVDKLIFTLKGAGVWTKLDRLWLYAAENSQSAGRDIKAAAAFASVNGSPTFTTNRGYTGTNASTTVFIDSGFNPSTAGGQYTQNLAHISAWIVDNAASSGVGGFAIGLQDIATTVSNIIPKFTDGNSYYRCNDAAPGSAGVANATSNAFFVASRTTNTQKDGYKNSADAGEGTANSAALTNGNFYILARNSVGTGANGGDGHQNAAVSIGGGLTSTDVTNFYNAMLTYMQAVGVV